MSEPVEITGFDLVAGTRDYYLDVAFYDAEYKGRRADVKWYGEHYADARAPCLELGVGSGRIAVPAVKKGAVITGIDTSPEMLAVAEAKRLKLKKKQDNLTLVQGDMRAFDLGAEFEVVTCPFNAFQHLYTREDIDACLACVRAHLARGGLFALDVLNPDYDYLTRSPFKRYPGVRFRHPTHKAHYTYSEQSAWDPIRQINQMWFHFDRDPGVDTHAPEHFVVQLSHRYFFPEELNMLLHHNGFEVVARCGDFELGDLRPDSDSIVVLARRR